MILKTIFALKESLVQKKNKDILIHFINDILELKDNDRIKEVTFLSPIQDPEIASKKQSIVDVLCEDENGMKIIVEMQVASTGGFEKRAQYYASKAYCGQLNKGQEADGQYKNLKEVIFIAIADCILFPGKSDYKSNHITLDKKTYDHDLKAFSFTFIELPKFNRDNIEQLDNIVEKWCYFFKHANHTSEADLKKLIGSDEVIEKAYEEVNQFNWTEQEKFAYDQEIKRIWDNRAVEEFKLETARKEGLKAGIEKGREEGMEKGIEKGLEEGIEKGLEEGIEKGREEAIAITARKMLQQNLNLKLISSVTGLSEQELLKLKNN